MEISKDALFIPRDFTESERDAIQLQLANPLLQAYFQHLAYELLADLTRLKLINNSELLTDTVATISYARGGIDTLERLKHKE